MNRKLARRLLATVAAGALMTLPASAALANPPEHANSGQAPERHVSEDDDGDASNDPDHQFGESQHPSGKDRTGHQDRPQGNAQSDPDDDGVGMDRDGRGEDKPGMGGGEYTDDQDGNNGCGNDQDFEDDNNGLCGGSLDDVDEGDEPIGGDETGGIGDENGGIGDEPGGNGELNGQIGDEQITESGDQQVVEVDAEVVALPESLGQPVTDDLPEDDGALVDVLAETAERPSPVTADTAPATDVAAASAGEVLGAAPTDTLPATGVPIVALGIGGLLTLGGGELLRRRTR